MLPLVQKNHSTTKVRQPLLHMDPKNILQFPRLVFSIATQLIYYSLTEVETFLLVVFCGLLGWQIGWRWGLVAFFGIYFCMRMLGGYLNAILNNLRDLAGVRGRNS